MTRLSIIIPVHNAESELPKCMESLLCQVGSSDEIILVEDSSTDNSGALCDRYAEQNPNIKAYHISFKGPSPTRNFGIEKAIGQYIMFVDSDDWMENGAIDAMLSRASEHELVVSGYFLENESSVAEKRLTGREVIPKEDALALHNTEMFGVLWNKIFHGDIIRKNNILFDTSFKKGEDLLFISEYIAHISTAIGIVDECFYHYISKSVGVNRSHRETMDNKRNRSRLIMKQLEAAKVNKSQFVHHNLNLYFRHIRDYMSGEGDCSIFKKLSFIKKEARDSIVADILKSHSNARIRFLRMLHALHLDVAMFVFNRMCL